MVRLIHSIPDLFNDSDLDRVELYIGRTGCTPRHVKGRWKIHRDEKDHEYALVAIRCPTDRIVRWEGMMVKILNRLKSRGRLCVRNAEGSGGGGRVADTDDSVVYITWRLKRRSKLTIPTRKDVREIAADLVEYGASSNPKITSQSIQKALDPITRVKSEKTDTEWHDNHG